MCVRVPQPEFRDWREIRMAPPQARPKYAMLQKRRDLEIAMALHDEHDPPTEESSQLLDPGSSKRFVGTLGYQDIYVPPGDQA